MARPTQLAIICKAAGCNQANLTNLQHLYLSDTKVSDAGLQHLANLTNLQHLYLGGPKVSDAGLQHLANLTNLQHLYLSGTKVSDAGLQHLANLTNLQHLYLSGTKVSDAVQRDPLPWLQQLRQVAEPPVAFSAAEASICCRPPPEVFRRIRAIGVRHCG